MTKVRSPMLDVYLTITNNVDRIPLGSAAVSSGYSYASVYHDIPLTITTPMRIYYLRWNHKYIGHFLDEQEKGNAELRRDDY